MKNESTIVGNVDNSTDINVVTYNDFTGFMGNDFPPVTTRTNLFSDNILYTTLKHLKDTGEYSKDIQNINIDDKYRLKINNWKHWIKYNKMHSKDLEKSMQFKYIDLFNNIQEKHSMNLLSRICLFLNENGTSNNTILVIEKKFIDAINKFRKQYFKLKITDSNINDAICADMNVLFAEVSNMKSILWKKGANTVISFSNIGALYNKVDSKILSKSIVLLRSFEKDLKKFIDAIIHTKDINNIHAVVKDLNVLKKSVNDSNSVFWTKISDISMVWSNTFKYLGM